MLDRVVNECIRADGTLKSHAGQANVSNKAPQDFAPEGLSFSGRFTLPFPVVNKRLPGISPISLRERVTARAGRDRESESCAPLKHVEPREIPRRPLSLYKAPTGNKDPEDKCQVSGSKRHFCSCFFLCRGVFARQSAYLT
jgi:hypothetical protein